MTKLVRNCYTQAVPKKYSLYEAKTKLSELVRNVREGGQPVTITLHGRPVAELRPIEIAPEQKSTAERHAELERAGHIYATKPSSGQARFPLGVRRPGGLKRFLKDRE